MSCTDRDLTLDEVLADPVIGAVMRADRVDPRRFETLLRTTARRLDRARDPGRPASGGIPASSVLPASGGIPASGVLAARLASMVQGACAGW